VTVVAPDAGDAGLHYSATVQPFTEFELDFQAEGSVQSIRQIQGMDGATRELQPGDPVTAGDELARLKEDEYIDKVDAAKARLARAEASLRKSKAAFERATHLQSTQSITAPEYDRARKDFEASEADVAGARAQLDRARLKLAQCVLEAPTDGVVLDRAIEVGSFARPGSAAFRIGDLRFVKLVFGVPDTAVGVLEVGQPVSFTTASAADRIFSGPVTTIGPVADSRTRVFEIAVKVENADGALRPGMIASLETPGTTRKSVAVAVPMRAILRAPGNASGYAVAIVDEASEGSVARLQEVELGEPAGDSVQVTSGLRAGQRVIVTGAQNVTDGSTVRVVP
jgi:RND family efflux transporter MFP subunit